MLKKLSAFLLCVVLCLSCAPTVYAEDTATTEETTEITTTDGIYDTEYGGGGFGGDRDNPDSVEIEFLTKEDWFSTNFTCQELDTYIYAAAEKNGINGLPSVEIVGDLGREMSYGLYVDLFSGDPNAEAFLEVYGAKLHINTDFDFSPITDFFNDYNAENPVETSLGVFPSASINLGNGYVATWCHSFSLDTGWNCCLNGQSSSHKSKTAIYKWVLTKDGATIAVDDNYNKSNYAYKYCDVHNVYWTDYSVSGYTVNFYGHFRNDLNDLPSLFRTNVPEAWRTYGTDNPTAIENGDPLPVWYVGDDGLEHQGYIIGDTVYNMDGNPVTNVTWRYDFDRMPSEYLNDLYNAFMAYLLENEYGQDINFDDSGIIKAIKSVYSKLEGILNTLKSNFKKLIGSLDDISDKLDILIADNTDDDAENDYSFSTEWLKIADKFKKKIAYDDITKSVDNISNAFFGERVFIDNSSSDTEMVTASVSGSAPATPQYAFISVLIKDKNGLETPSSFPTLTVEIFGEEYSLYSLVPFMNDIHDMLVIKEFIGFFLWATFIIGLFRSIPGIISSAGGVSSHIGVEITDTIDYPDFQYPDIKLLK